MPSSSVTLKEKSVDDVCVHLISGNSTSCCTQSCTTPDEVSSIPSGDLQIPGKLPLFTIDYHHLAFSRADKGKHLPDWRWYASNLPLFTIAVSIIQIIFYFELTPEIRHDLNFDPRERSQVYRFITYMLLHVGALHLVFNVLLQNILGTPLEIEQGHLRTAILYIGGGVGGALGAAVTEPTTAVEGSSAGVYAILIAHIPHMILNYQDLRYKISRIAVVFILLFADVGHTIYHISSNGNDNPRISVAAHVFGALTGMILGFLFFTGTSRWNVVLKCLSLVTYLILVVLAYLNTS